MFGDVEVVSNRVVVENFTHRTAQDLVSREVPKVAKSVGGKAETRRTLKSIARSGRESVVERTRATFQNTL